MFYSESHEIKSITGTFYKINLSLFQDLAHAPTDVGSSTSGDLSGIISKKGFSGPTGGEKFATGIIPRYNEAQGSGGISLSPNDAPGALMHTFVYGAEPYHSLDKKIDLEITELWKDANIFHPNYEYTATNKNTGQIIVYRSADLIAPSCGPAQEYFARIPGSDEYYQGYDLSGSTRSYSALIDRSNSDDSGQFVSWNKDNLLGITSIDGISYSVNGAPLPPREDLSIEVPQFIYKTSNIWYTLEHTALSPHVVYFIAGIGPVLQPSTYLAGNIKQLADPTRNQVICAAQDTSMTVFKAGGARIDPAIWLFTIKTAYAKILESKNAPINFGDISKNSPDPAYIQSSSEAFQAMKEVASGDSRDKGLCAIIAVKDNGTGNEGSINCGWKMDVSCNQTSLLGASGIDARNSTFEIVAGDPYANQSILDDNSINKTRGFIASFSPGVPPVIYYQTRFQPTGQLVGKLFLSNNQNFFNNNIFFKRGWKPIPFGTHDFSVSVEVFGDTMVISTNAGGDDLQVPIAPNLGVQQGWTVLESGFQSSFAELNPKIQLNISRETVQFGWQPIVYKSWNSTTGIFEYQIAHLSVDAILNGDDIIYRPYGNHLGGERINAAYRYTNKTTESQLTSSPISEINQQISDNLNISNNNLLLNSHKYLHSPPDIIADSRSIADNTSKNSHKLAVEVRALSKIANNANIANDYSNNYNDVWSQPNETKISIFGEKYVKSPLLTDSEIQNACGFGLITKIGTIASINGLFTVPDNFIKKPIPCIILWADAWANSQVIHIWPNYTLTEWIERVEKMFAQRNKHNSSNGIGLFTTASGGTAYIDKDITSFSLSASLNGLIVQKKCSITLVNPNFTLMNYIDEIKSQNNGFAKIKINLKEIPQIAKSKLQSQCVPPNQFIDFEGFVYNIKLRHTNSGTSVTLDMQDPFSFLMEKLTYPAQHSIDGWNVFSAIKYLIYRTGLPVDLTDLEAVFNPYLPINRIGRYVATDVFAASLQFGSSNLASNLPLACGPMLYENYPIFYWDEIDHIVKTAVLDKLIENTYSETQEGQAHSAIQYDITTRLKSNNEFTYDFDTTQIKYNVFVKTLDRFRGSPMWSCIPNPNNNAITGYKSEKIFNANNFTQVSEHITRFNHALQYKFIPYMLKPSTSINIHGLPPRIPLHKYNEKGMYGLLGIGSQIPKSILPDVGNVVFDTLNWAKWMYVNQTTISWNASEGNYISSTINYKTLTTPFENIASWINTTG